MRGIFRLSVRRQAKPWPKWKRNGNATAFCCRASDEKNMAVPRFGLFTTEPQKTRPSTRLRMRGYEKFRSWSFLDRLVVTERDEIVTPAIPAQRQVTSGIGAGVEVLVKPLGRRNHDAPRFPVHPGRFPVFGPEQ